MRSLRAWRMTGVMVLVALLIVVGRGIWANGVFSNVPTGFLGRCKVLAQVSGIEDIEIAGDMAFVSVASARGFSD
ncbi:MAG TPA: hypothetical protein VGC16_07935, partial [Rhizomicrobium sp.]